MSEQHKPTYNIDALEAADSRELTSGQVLDAFADKRAELKSKAEEISSRPGFKLDAIGIMQKRREESQVRDELAEFEKAYAELGGDAIDRAQEAVDALNFRSSAEERARALAELSGARDEFYRNFISTKESDSTDNNEQSSDISTTRDDTTVQVKAEPKTATPSDELLNPSQTPAEESDSTSSADKEVSAVVMASEDNSSEPVLDKVGVEDNEANERYKKGDVLEYDGNSWGVANRILDSESGDEVLYLQELDKDGQPTGNKIFIRADELDNQKDQPQSLTDKDNDTNKGNLSEEELQKIVGIDTSWVDKAETGGESDIARAFRENPHNPDRFAYMMKTHREAAEQEPKKRRFLGVFSSATDYLFKRAIGLKRSSSERVQDVLDKRAVPGYGEMSKKEKAVLALGVIGITALAYQMQRNGGDIDFSILGDLTNGESPAELSFDPDTSPTGTKLPVPEGEVERELPMPEGDHGSHDTVDSNGSAEEESSSSSQHESDADTDDFTEVLADKFEVQNGSSFTQELIDVAKKAGVELSKSDSYDLYKALVRELGVNNIIEGVGTYQIPGSEDYGLSNVSESATWTPNAQKIIAEYLNNLRG